MIAMSVVVNWQCAQNTTMYDRGPSHVSAAC